MEWLKFFIGLFLGSALTYLANKMIKFSEMQLQFLIEKLKKYDALWESYLRLLSPFENESYVQRWNHSQSGSQQQELLNLHMDVDRNYRVATFFMSDDMGLLHEYLQKRIFRDLFLQSNLEESYFQNFKNDMTEKSKLMNDLIKAECSKESLAKSLMYESFFDFDLKFSSRLQDLENWRLKNASVFDAMKNYVESH